MTAMELQQTARASAPISRRQLHAVAQEIWRLIRYGLVSISNVVVSLITLNLFFFFVHPTSPLILVIGSSAAYLVGDINSYWWNRGFTFGLPRATWGSFLRFGVVSLAAMALNAGVVWGFSGMLLHSFLPTWLQTNLSQVSASISGGLGYVVCRLWVFKTTGTM